MPLVGVVSRPVESPLQLLKQVGDRIEYFD